MLLEAKYLLNTGGGEKEQGFGKGSGKIKQTNLTRVFSNGSSRSLQKKMVTSLQELFIVITTVIPGSQPLVHLLDEKQSLGSLLISLVGFKASC